MINSLSKDSHITQYHRFYNSGYDSNQKNTGTNVSKSAPSYNQTITVRKPAEISFSGFSGPEMARDPEFVKFINEVKTTIGNSPKLGKVKKFIFSAIESLEGNSKFSNEEINKFITNEENKKYLNTLINNLDNTVKGKYETQYDKFSSRRKHDERNDIMKAAVDGVFGLEQPNRRFYNSKRVQQFLEIATDHKTVFGAFFALVLTCTLRPLAIMATPADKKNADDKKYASAHSISSGMIGFLISLGFLSPFAIATNKLMDTEKYNKDFKIIKEGSYLLKDRAIRSAAKSYFSMLPDTVISPIKASITIALLPIILKKVFGLEKKKHDAKAQEKPQNPIQSTTATSSTFQDKSIPNTSNTNVKTSKSVSFGSESNFFKQIRQVWEQIKMPFNALTTAMAKGFAKLAETKPVRALLEKTVKYDKFRKNLVAHLSALTSIILSGFYVKKTLSNDNLDSRNKKTLAINQASVCAVSTISAYTFDKIINKKVEEIINKMQAINYGKIEPERLGKIKDGVRSAASIMIFGVVYRFLAPVFVTPIANRIGNSMGKPKENKN